METYRLDIATLVGFPTHNKIPLTPWRQGTRQTYEKVMETSKQFGFVPAEQELSSFRTLVVLDLDIRPGGDGAADLRKNFRNLPNSFNVKTPHGFHLYYMVPKSIVIPQATAKPIRGARTSIDIRHADGYVCLGEGYTPATIDYVVDCPEPLLNWLTSATKEKEVRCKVREYEPTVVSNQPRKRFTPNLSPIRKGCRNDTMFRWGCGMLNGVKNGELTVQNICDLMKIRGEVSGLTNQEIDRLIDQVLSNL